MFQENISGKMAEDMLKKRKLIFGLLDENKNNEISLNELQKFLREVFKE